MRVKHIIISSVILAIVAFSYTSDIFSGKEAQVRRRFRHLVQFVTVNESVPALERILKAKKVDRYFAEKIVGTLHFNDDQSRTKEVKKTDIVNYLLAAYRNSSEVTCEILSDHYSLNEEGVVAKIKLRIFGKEFSNTDRYLEEFDLTLLYEMIDGEWKIKQVEASRVEDR